MRKKGFTMIEILVVIAVMGILSAVTLVSLSSGKNDSRLRAAQREVASAVKLAQSYALQGKAQEEKTPCAYGFRFTSDVAYEIFYKSAEAGSDCSSPYFTSFVPMEQYQLKDGVVLQNHPDKSLTEVYFSIPFGKMFTKGGGEVIESRAGGDIGDKGYFALRYDLNFSGNLKYVGIKPGGYVIEYDN